MCYVCLVEDGHWVSGANKNTYMRRHSKPKINANIHAYNYFVMHFNIPSYFLYIFKDRKRRIFQFILEDIQYIICIYWGYLSS